MTNDLNTQSFSTDRAASQDVLGALFIIIPSLECRPQVSIFFASSCTGFKNTMMMMGVGKRETAMQP